MRTATSTENREQLLFFSQKKSRNSHARVCLSPIVLCLRSVPFSREEHAAYLMSGLGTLPSGYTSLDASRPWLCYWIMHSLEMLGEPHALRGQPAEDVANFLNLCQDKEGGGFAGGPHPGQLAHLAPTYAAINTLVTIGTPTALDVIDRTKLKAFLMSMRTPEGAFTMHHDGEIDVRGAYIAMAVATLTDIMDEELVAGTAEWITQCQTYEGGMGATPGEEAHGGYTFCALAAMVLLGKAEMLRLEPLTRWLVNRQMSVHGGFQGRTNKLVDGCYSFWQGGAFPLLESVLTQRGDLPRGGIKSLFSTEVRARARACVAAAAATPAPAPHASTSPHASACLLLPYRSSASTPPPFRRRHRHAGIAGLPLPLLPSTVRRHARQAWQGSRLLSHLLLSLWPRCRLR